MPPAKRAGGTGEAARNLYAARRLLHGSGTHARRRFERMDALAIVLALVMFALLYGLIYAIDWI